MISVNTQTMGASSIEAHSSYSPSHQSVKGVVQAITGNSEFAMWLWCRSEECRQRQAGLCQRPIHQRNRLAIRNAPRHRQLGDKHMPRAVEHLLFAEGKWLFVLQN